MDRYQVLGEKEGREENREVIKFILLYLKIESYKLNKNKYKDKQSTSGLFFTFWEFSLKFFCVLG
jgi:hypothetical protein